MKKMSKKRFDAECAKLKPQAASFKRKVTRFCKKHEALRKELVDVIGRVIKAGEDCHLDDDFDKCLILVEGSKTTGSCAHEPVPGTEEYANRYIAWPVLAQNLRLMITRLNGRDDVPLLPGLEQFALPSPGSSAMTQLDKLNVW